MAMIKKKVMGKPMKAQKGKMISESGDLAEALNETERMRKAGTVPKTPTGAAKVMDKFQKQGKLGPAKPAPKKSMKMGGAMKKAKNGFGMLSVKAKVDNNPGITAADRIAGATMKDKAKMGKAVKKCKYGCK
jgi:hypothetical protein